MSYAGANIKTIRMTNGSFTSIDTECGVRLAAIESAMQATSPACDTERLQLRQLMNSRGLKPKQWYRLFGLEARAAAEQAANNPEPKPKRKLKSRIDYIAMFVRSYELPDPGHQPTVIPA